MMHTTTSQPDQQLEAAMLANPSLVADVYRRLFSSRMALTAKQNELLEFLRAYQNAYKIAPSYEEMMLALSLRSKSGVHRLVSSLEERGHIRKIPSHARTIVIIGEEA